MIGAVVSDARLDRMYNRPIQPCSWCQNPNAIPCWDQTAWSCPAFSSSRPRRPASAFQRILGWPTGRNPRVTALKFRINSDKCSGSRPLAVRADGEVVTRGDSGCGGGSSSIQKRFRNVLQIQAMDAAFAAILTDGSVVTWGHKNYGGDSSQVQDQLKNVQQVQATGTAFAAVLADGSVVTWGKPDCGADSSAVQDQLEKCVAGF